jgi:23S rRNA pseudouridine1911/1915/1917 synthase
MSAANKTTFEVTTDDAGLRLDQVIPRHVGGLSRRKARAVIDLGGVFVDRTRVKVAGRQLRAGQIVEVVIGGALENSKSATLEPAIVFVDEHIIIADKPAGLVTAPTPESDRGDLLDQLKRRFGEVYLVHRLDQPTSGLLVFARTREANKLLGDAFKVHDVEREYRAIVVGNVVEDRFTIDRPVDGRRAVTHITVIERRGATTAVAAKLETGRTHQIRIHLAGIGHPVLGDRQHGGELERHFEPRPSRLMLHARVLGFVHPHTKQPVRFEANAPETSTP